MPRPPTTIREVPGDTAQLYAAWRARKYERLDDLGRVVARNIPHPRDQTGLWMLAGPGVGDEDLLIGIVERAGGNAGTGYYRWQTAKAQGVQRTKEDAQTRLLEAVRNIIIHFADGPTQ